MERVLSYVEAGKAEGAKLVYGGERIMEAPLDRGNFVTPAIFSGCTDEMKIVREEIFGPVMSVLTFTDEDEVIKRANATRFGLAAECLRAISRAGIGSPTGSRPASAGSTTIMSRRSRCRSAVRRNQASATRTDRPQSSTTRS